MRCVVHGDDFAVLGDRKHLDWFRSKIKGRYPVKIRGRLGPRESDDKQIRILNRILTWGKSGIEYEADQRHAEIVIRELGLKDDSREVSSPADKRMETQEPRKLEGAESTQYRAMVARMNYLCQDRTDIAYTVKELSKDMSSPDTDSIAKLKRLGRYLKGTPRYVTKYPYQEIFDKITLWTDTDSAGCTKSRKSTSAGIIQLGKHLIKSWSTNQAVIALSSGEAEYYGMVKGGSMGLGSKAILDDLGIHVSEPFELKTDASAAIGIACRVGIGKIRHIEVNQLWLQHRIARGDFVAIKVDGEHNLADALTKVLGGLGVSSHVDRVGSYTAKDRHELAPSLEDDTGEHFTGDQEEE